MDENERQEKNSKREKEIIVRIGKTLRALV